jgi:SAM-dependent methyltransferase
VPLQELTRTLRDTGRIVAHALGLRDQFDAFAHEKFDGLREYYRSPVLDFGAGTCLFTMRLKRAGLDVTPVDVVNASRFPAAQLRVVEGPRLPFGDGSYETSIAHFVLHHITRQDESFGELVRVTRGTIVVAEDVVDRWTDALVAWIHTGTSPWSRAWTGFRSTAGWLEFFAGFPVDVLATRTIPRWRTPFYPVKRVIFVLRVRPQARAAA